MITPPIARVAVVDYGLGNMFSVENACRHEGMEAALTSDADEILRADAVILPGVGAFGDAMEALCRLDLVNPLKDAAASDKPLIGICLGMQLLMTESYEFGRHHGLGIIPGPVVRFESTIHPNVRGVPVRLKVPQVGWNRIIRFPSQDTATKSVAGSGHDPWSGSLLGGLPDGTYMYFVHSYYVKPDEPQLSLSMSRYGNVEFCSSVSFGNVFACQFHPERSGPQGLRIYGNLAALIRKRKILE